MDETIGLFCVDIVVVLDICPTEAVPRYALYNVHCTTMFYIMLYVIIQKYMPHVSCLTFYIIKMNEQLNI